MTSGEVADLAERYGLRHLGGRPPLGGYLRQLWQRRHFALELARSRFRAEREQLRLGVAWVVLQPLITAAVYGLVFGLILLRDQRPENYLPFLVSGVFFFQYFAGCLTEGSRAIVSNLGLVTTLHFPRAVLPIAVVIKQTMALGAMIAALCVLVLIDGNGIRVSWLLMLPTVVLFGLFNLGVAFFAARVTIHVRDVAQLIPFITRIFFYLSGIFVSLPRLAGEGTPLLSILQFNPVYIYITMARVSLLGPQEDIVGEHYDPVFLWGMGAAWGLGLLLVAFVFFWRAEDEYGRE